MWFRGEIAEVAVQCPHCSGLDWRTPDELKGGRLFCFFCARISVWPTGNARGEKRAPA